MSEATETVGRLIGEWQAARAEGFYVTVRHGKRSGALLGPYATHGEAEDNVGRARQYAMERVDFASFYTYGTAKMTAKPGHELKPGKLNEAIGLTAPC